VIKRYSELVQLPSFRERFEYLKIGGRVGAVTFGEERYLNQILYKMPIWESIRKDIIVRDNGCDLGLSGYDIHGLIIVHHMNPITIADVVSGDTKVFDPEFLICVSLDTHNAIHYGDVDRLAKEVVERKPNDTCPWR